MITLSMLPSKQRGAALFVSLMMLILVSILGVTGVRLVSLEERMAGNSYDRNIAFQVAEAALRAGEKVAEDQTTPASVAWTDVSSDELDLDDFNLLNTAPRYRIEYLGGNLPCARQVTPPYTCELYRITASSNPGTGRATVMLQSVYATD